MSVQGNGERHIPLLHVDTQTVDAVTATTATVTTLNATTVNQTGDQAITGSLTVTSGAAATVPVTVVPHASQSGLILQVKKAADANPTFAIDSSSILKFGAGGGSATDCSFYRASAGVMRFDGTQVVFGHNVTFDDTRNLIFSTTTGTKIGTATGEKIGFWNATPVARQSAYTQTYATADKTHANPTAATLTVADGAGTNDNTIGAITADASVIAAVQEIVDEVNKLIADVADVKQLVNSVIDDFQTIGLLA